MVNVPVDGGCVEDVHREVDVDEARRAEEEEGLGPRQEPGVEARPGLEEPAQPATGLGHAGPRVGPFA